MSPVNWQPFCSGPKVLKWTFYVGCMPAEPRACPQAKVCGLLTGHVETRPVSLKKKSLAGMFFK